MILEQLTLCHSSIKQVTYLYKKVKPKFLINANKLFKINHLMKITQWRPVYLMWRIQFKIKYQQFYFILTHHMIYGSIYSLRLKPNWNWLQRHFLNFLLFFSRTTKRDNKKKEDFLLDLSYPMYLPPVLKLMMISGVLIYRKHSLYHLKQNWEKTVKYQWNQ